MVFSFSDDRDEPECHSETDSTRDGEYSSGIKSDGDEEEEDDDLLDVPPQVVNQHKSAY